MQSKKEKRWKDQNYRCCWCGKTLPLDLATVEHIVPRSLGGRDTFENLAVSHMTCNKARGSNLFQDPHPSFVFDHVRKRLKDYHDGIARQDISKLGLEVPIMRWSEPHALRRGCGE